MIEILIALLVGIWIGKTVTNVINQWTFRQILDDLDVSDKALEQLRDRDAAVPTNIVEIKLEQHQGQLYAFRKDNDQFLGQGPDREQLITRLQREFSKGTTVVVRDGADLIKG